MRRVLIGFARGGLPFAMELDVDGSCESSHTHTEHGLDGRAYHTKMVSLAREPGKQHRVAVRCPSSLTEDEKLRVVEDDPPGSWLERAKELKAQRETAGTAPGTDFTKL